MLKAKAKGGAGQLGRLTGRGDWTEQHRVQTRPAHPNQSVLPSARASLSASRARHAAFRPRREMYFNDRQRSGVALIIKSEVRTYAAVVTEIPMPLTSAR